MYNKTSLKYFSSRLFPLMNCRNFPENECNQPLLKKRRVGIEREGKMEGELGFGSAEGTGIV